MFNSRHLRPAGTSAVALLAMLLAGACGSDPAGIDEPIDDPVEESEVLTLPTEWTFDTGTEGWDLTASSNGSAVYDPAEGRIVLSGYGVPGEANASISRVVNLPAVGEDVILWIDVFVAADCLDNGDNDTFLRITAASSEEGTVIIRDWTRIHENIHAEGGSLEAFAGETVTITIEQDDEGDQQSPDDPESACIDRISIFDDG